MTELFLCVREGNIPDIVACGSLHEFLCKTHEEYGPVVSFWLGPTLCISIGSAELFAQQANAFDQAGECTVVCRTGCYSCKLILVMYVLNELQKDVMILLTAYKCSGAFAVI